MSKTHNLMSFAALMMSALLVSVAPLDTSAKDLQQGQASRIRVFPDHYAAGSSKFTDLEALATWVGKSGARSLEFHSCMWTTNARLVAAIERFKHFYLDVRWIKPGTSGCPAVMPDK